MFIFRKEFLHSNGIESHMDLQMKASFVYQSTLDFIQTEMAIKQVEDHFERN